MSSMIPSNTSGISFSKSRSRNSGEVLDMITAGLPFSPFDFNYDRANGITFSVAGLCKICWDFGRNKLNTVMVDEAISLVANLIPVTPR